MFRRCVSPVSVYPRQAWVTPIRSFPWHRRRHQSVRTLSDDDLRMTTYGRVLSSSAGIKTSCEAQRQSSIGVHWQREIFMIKVFKSIYAVRWHHLPEEIYRILSIGNNASEATSDRGIDTQWILFSRVFHDEPFNTHFICGSSCILSMSTPSGGQRTSSMTWTIPLETAWSLLTIRALLMPNVWWRGSNINIRNMTVNLIVWLNQ